MIRAILGIFFVLHGFVHLLYLGQSTRLFEMRPGLAWPDGAWMLSKFLGAEQTRVIAGILLVIAALLFITGGIGLLARLIWWRQVAVAAAIFSAAVYLLLWNGLFENLADNGWVGIAINAAITAALLGFNWPKL